MQRTTPSCHPWCRPVYDLVPAPVAPRWRRLVRWVQVVLVAALVGLVAYHLIN